MARMSRRAFFKEAAADAAAAGVLATQVAGLHANPLGLPIGSQTWPHRAMLKHGFSRRAEAARRPRRAGDRAVLAARLRRLREGWRRAPRSRRSSPITASRCRSCHYGMKELRQSQGAEHRVVARRRHHADDHGVARRPRPSDAGRREDGRPTSITQIAAVAAKAGIQQGLHNEGFEIVDGRRQAHLRRAVRPARSEAGQVPVPDVDDQPGLRRARSTSRSTPAASTRCTCRTGIRRPGPRRRSAKARIDWKKVFAAAKTGGVKNYFVEQDMEMTKQGVAFLKALNV